MSEPQTLRGWLATWLHDRKPCDMEDCDDPLHEMCGHRCAACRKCQGDALADAMDNLIEIRLEDTYIDETGVFEWVRRNLIGENVQP